MPRRTAERTAETRAALLASAREQFATHGYAATSTETILAATDLTRGALYHHFRDKADLLRAVCEELHSEAVATIEHAAQGETAFDALVAGCEAWIDFMAVPEHHRLLILEAPAVLGWETWQALDATHGYRSLQEGVAAAQADGFGRGILADSLALFLNGALNQLVLSSEPARHRPGFRALLDLLR